VSTHARPATGPQPVIDQLASRYALRGILTFVPTDDLAAPDVDVA
jgi:hypothetical protein